ncbi:hypothetical protein [Chitinimonas lacunae]|uniref:Uncharacterized protein n=1 Tax=Chitinimonas lacunae TaxID=1963018 RepID=A0ABV8MV53_9NEIS
MPYQVELELSYHPKLDYSALERANTFRLIEGIREIGEGWISSSIYWELSG